ncbi:MAG: DUF86 domain-containing protein [Synergistaceae bacterium]|jgi:uncharacterized protein with HEPN domain|nr:DUF86 domain-containing protein [Synergistaceae bacterium]
MNERDQKNITNMLNYIEKALSYVDGMNFEDFSEDKKTQYAVSFCLQQVGDGVKNISAETQYLNSHISWHGISAFRNKVVHEYEDVNVKSLFKFLERDLRALQRDLFSLVDSKNRTPNVPL